MTVCLAALRAVLDRIADGGLTTATVAELAAALDAFDRAYRATFH